MGKLLFLGLGVAFMTNPDKRSFCVQFQNKMQRQTNSILTGLVARTVSEMNMFNIRDYCFFSLAFSNLFRTQEDLYAIGIFGTWIFL